MVNELYKQLLVMAPIRVEFEITEACNLKCLFCYNTLLPNYSPTSDAIALLDCLAKQGVLEIILTGGEPLFHPDFAIIARHAGNLFPTVLLQTNGTLLDDTLIAVLKEANFTGVNISVHGDERVHDYLTGTPGSHRLAMRAVDILLASSLTAWVNTVLTVQNFAILEHHLCELKSRGVRNFTFTRFTPVGSGRDSSLNLAVPLLVDAIHTIERFREANPECSVLVANAVPRCILPPALKHYSEPCSYGLSRFYVNTKGDLMHCGMSRAVIGNLFENAICDIKANSSTFRELCLGDLMPDSCSLCGDVEKCRGGCRAAALAATGTMNGSDPLTFS